MKLRLQYKGVFDTKDLHDKLVKYFKAKEFAIMETAFKDKGDELEVETKFEQKTTSYCKCEGEYKINVWGLKKVEKDGKVMDQGRFQIDFKAEVKKDYEERFKSDKDKKMKNMYEKSKKKEIEGVEKLLILTIFGADALLKKELGMDV